MTFQYLIFDPGLGVIPGHWTKYNQLLVEGLSAAGGNGRVVGFRKQDQEILRGFLVDPLFTNDPYVDWLVWEDDDKTEVNIRKFSKIFKNNLNLYFEKFVISEKELRLIFPTITPYIFWGILDFLSDCNLPDDINLHLIFQFEEGVDIERPDYHSNVQGRFYQRGMTYFSEVLSKYQSIKLFSSTKIFAQQLSAIFMPEVIPLPILQHRVANIERSEKEKLVSLGVFGQYRDEKGTEFMHPMLLRLIQLRQILLNLHYNPQGEEIDPLIPLLEKSPATKLFKGFISDDEMSELMNRADIVVIPSAAWEWGERNMHAVFIEAASMGKVCVVPDGTVMSEEVQKFGNGISFKHFSKEDIQSALLEAISSYRVLSRRAAKAAPKFLSSNNLKNYVKVLLSNA